MNLAHKVLARLLTAVLLAAGPAIATDPPKEEARVTQIIRDVKILSFKSPARPAVVNDQVRENTALRTGTESRSELTFEDLTITRLGSNTIFSFNKAGRSGTLGSGAVLLHVPKESGGGEFKTAGVTVGITGTTVILESTREGRNKLTVLEGSALLTLVKHPEQSAEARGGQMLDVAAGAAKIPAPVDVDLAEIMKKNPLIKDFPPLPSRDLMLAVVRDQQNSAPSGSTRQKKPKLKSSTPIPQTSTPAPTPKITTTRDQRSRQGPPQSTTHLVPHLNRKSRNRRRLKLQKTPPPKETPKPQASLPPLKGTDAPFKS